MDTLGEIYFWAGRFDLAIEKFKEALAIKPDFFHSIRHITYSYALKEDYTEAIKWADEHSTRSSDPFNKATGYFLKAFFEYWTGLYDKALEEAEKARMVSEETQNLVILGNIYVLKELTYRQQGDFSSSRDSLMKYVDAMLSHFKDAPTDVVPAMKAVIEADFGSLEIQEGKIKEARKRLERLDQLLSESEILQKEEESTGLVKKYFLGELLMAEGSFDEAIAILEQVQFEEFQFSYLGILSTNLYFPEIYIARAYELKGETDKAIEKLERLIRFDPASKDFRLTPPKVYYDLGRLYEKKGQKEKARENYEKFLKLWKDADPGLPEVEDARKRLAGLKQ